MQSRDPQAEDTHAILPSQDGASQPILPVGHPQAGRLLGLPRRRRPARRGGTLPWQVGNRLRVSLLRLLALGWSGAMASSSSPSLSPPPKSSSVSDNAGEEGKQELQGKIRGHEVAISELEHVQPSRAVYQKSGNIFFRRSIKTAIASEQKQLDLAKSRLQKLNAI
ncbi:unnamed protein product [Musa banksii]